LRQRLTPGQDQATKSASLRIWRGVDPPQVACCAGESLRPDHHVVAQIISWLWPTRATINYRQDSSECPYSPTILSNTRFRRPSNSP
jgi:hypothetical protein